MCVYMIPIYSCFNAVRDTGTGTADLCEANMDYRQFPSGLRSCEVTKNLQVPRTKSSYFSFLCQNVGGLQVFTKYQKDIL